MLVLSRKKGESVVVDGKITIVVVDVRGDKARIGIEAPAAVAVYRSEVLAKKATGEETRSSGASAKRPKTEARGAKPTLDETVETLCLSKASESYRRGEPSKRSDDAKPNEPKSGKNVKQAN